MDRYLLWELFARFKACHSVLLQFAANSTSACGLGSRLTMTNVRSIRGQANNTARKCTAAIALQRVIRSCASKDEGTMANLIHLEEDEVGGETEQIDRARKAAWENDVRR